MMKDCLKIKKLKERIENLRVGDINFSILDRELPDHFCLSRIPYNDNFSIFYLDDRGNKLFESEYDTFEKASEELLKLIKSMS